jgi:hypothetical protein
MQLAGTDRDPYFRSIYHAGNVFRVHVEEFLIKKKWIFLSRQFPDSPKHGDLSAGFRFQRYPSWVTTLGLSTLPLRISQPFDYWDTAHGYSGSALTQNIAYRCHCVIVRDPLGIHFGVSNFLVSNCIIYRFGEMVTSPTLCSGGPGFESQPGDRLSWQYYRHSSVPSGKCGRDNTLK